MINFQYKNKHFQSLPAGIAPTTPEELSTDQLRDHVTSYKHGEALIQVNNIDYARIDEFDGYNDRDFVKHLYEKFETNKSIEWYTQIVLPELDHRGFEVVKEEPDNCILFLGSDTGTPGVGFKKQVAKFKVVGPELREDEDLYFLAAKSDKGRYNIRRCELDEDDIVLAKKQIRLFYAANYKIIVPPYFYHCYK